MKCRKCKARVAVAVDMGTRQKIVAGVLSRNDPEAAGGGYYLAFGCVSGALLAHPVDAAALEIAMRRGLTPANNHRDVCPGAPAPAEPAAAPRAGKKTPGRAGEAGPGAETAPR